MPRNWPESMTRYAQWLALSGVLLSCSSLDREFSTAKGLGNDCGQTQFAAAFSAYRANSANTRLWPLARCHLAIPESTTAAYALQAAYVAEHVKGRARVGYKVALGSKGAQALLGATAPVTGVLFDSTLLPNGTRLKADEAQRIAVEADLLVTVKSEKINDAKTIEQVAANLSKISAYIELPDLVLPFKSDMASRFIATNAGAFRGVVGDSVLIDDTRDAVQNLAAMTVELRDAHGEILSSRSGRSLMGHPLNAVLFLLQRMHDQGRSLQAGDVLSLGAYSQPIALESLSAESGKRFSVHYFGLVDQEITTPLSATVFF